MLLAISVATKGAVPVAAVPRSIEPGSVCVALNDSSGSVGPSIRCVRRGLHHSRLGVAVGCGWDSALHHRLDRSRVLLGRYGDHHVGAEVRICLCQNKHPGGDSGVFESQSGLARSITGRELAAFRVEELVPLHRRREVVPVRLPHHAEA